jgi:CheY-like chemotaxis protein
MLSVIIGRATLLRDRAAPAELGDDLDGIIQAAQNAAAILRRLQARDEAEAGGADLRVCVELALAVIRPPDGSAWRPAPGDPGSWYATVDVAADLETSVPACEVCEVLHNLLLNALAAMPQGGGVVIAAETAADRLRLTVADTGPGLSPAARQRIFVPGYSTSGEAGRGVGLAACRQLLAERGGGLELAPARADGGAVFALDLPVGAVDPSAGPSADPATVPRGLAVLVVEDEPGVADMLADVLAAWGCRAVLAGDAAAVRADFTGARYDAALVDWNLPGESGRDLVAWMRSRDATLPIVLTTGLDREGELAGTVGTAVDFTLVKPLDLDDLRRILGAALDLAAQRGRGPAGTEEDP